MAPTAALLFLVNASWVEASNSASYQYVSPLPNSRDVSPLNNIAIRDGRDLERASLGRTSLTATGSASGLHTGRLALSDDGKTMVFNPDTPFSPGETVAVAMTRGPLTWGAAELPALTFSFTVSRVEPGRYPYCDPEDLSRVPSADAATLQAPASTPAPAQTQGDLPAGYPTILLRASNNPDPGSVFVTPVNRGVNPPSAVHMAILDNRGMPIFYRKQAGRPADFKKLDDGRLVFHDATKGQYYALNEFYATVDSFKMGNGYTTDNHDLQVLPNNHALLMAYDNEPVDMSAIVPGGRPDAIVTGMVLQEIDADKNVVWQWRSWDHFQITDATDCQSLTDSLIDYVHGNSLEYDLDGNILVSCRSMSEITKIDRQTGDIIWRFGGNARNNQFTIVGDPLGFSDQHDARRLPNGHITLYDNHNCIAPKNSRALEYEMDEQNKVATLVWDYHYAPEQSATGTGNVQRRANGGTTISWGQALTPPNVTELHADGSIAYELQFWTKSATYRAFRYSWKGMVFTTNLEALDFGAVPIDQPATLPLTVTNNSAASLNLTSFVSTDSAIVVADAVPITLPAGGSVTVQVRFSPSVVKDYDATLYVRSGTATQLLAQPVTIRGHGDVSTAALMSALEADWTGPGLVLRWEFGTAEAFVSTSVERSESATGPWTRIAGEIQQDGARMSMLDPGAVAGRAYYYRVTGTTAGGRIVVSPTLAVAGKSIGSRTLQLSVAPSPSRGETQIRFTVPRDERVRLSVLDAQGRVMTVLADGIRAAGEHHVAWDGRRGNTPAPAGLYFVRIERAGEKAVRRVVLVR